MSYYASEKVCRAQRLSMTTPRPPHCFAPAEFVGPSTVARRLATKTAPRHFEWVERNRFDGALRPQTPHRSPRQAFGGNWE